MEKNIYAQIMEKVAEGEGVSVDTKIKGESGNIAEGLNRTIGGVKNFTDVQGVKQVNTTSEQIDGDFIVNEPILPKERLIVLGAGHVAIPVCEFAAKTGFDVYVCDDRPAFANWERFPHVKEVLCDTFENCIAGLRITQYDYVVIITRGHVHDADCLRMILPNKRQPAYLGLIGSRRRVRGLLEMLAAEGFNTNNIERICTPIGLDIGAVTPAEIAVSILAEIISYKRKPEHGAENRYVNASDLDLDIIEYLAENKEPKAIVTVMETKGSTPRGAGAKMAVSPTGKVTGSIGGGCSEGAIIRDAIDIIGTGQYKRVFIDMTGEVAESDGMVCGGVMYALIEDGTER